MRNTLYHYSVNVKENSSWDLSGLLDMLRYERSNVENWTRIEKGLRVDIVGPRPPVTDRWISFGMRPYSRRTEGDTYHVTDF